MTNYTHRFGFLCLLGLMLLASNAYSIQGVPNLAPPRVDLFKLNNGVSLYYLRDASLPLVDMTIYFDLGEINDPQGKSGTLRLLFRNLISGGSDEMTPEEITKALKSLGATYTSYIDREYAVMALSSLSQNALKVLNIYLRALVHPRFDQKEFKISKMLTIEDLRREMTSPDKVVSKTFVSNIYGPSNPYGKYPSIPDIKKITKEDLANFYRDYLGPSKVIVAVSGDISADDIKSELEKFASKNLKDLPVLPKVQEASPKDQKITRPLLTNSFIRMGHLGIDRKNPDIFALEVLNFILGGGGFQSRLMGEVRSEEGLAYSIHSNFAPMKDLGIFMISVSTSQRNEKRVIDIVEKNLEKLLLDDNVTAKELKLAKKTLLFNQIFSFQEPFSVVNQIAQYQLLGYPQDFWKIYEERIAKITSKDVEKAAKKYLKPKALTITIVGPEKKDAEKEASPKH